MLHFKYMIIQNPMLNFFFMQYILNVLLNWLIRFTKIEFSLPFQQFLTLDIV